MRENILAEKSIDFTVRIIKLHISLKETAETEYWLRLLVKSELLTRDKGESLLRDCLEIKRLLVSSIDTAKKNNR